MHAHTPGSAAQAARTATTTSLQLHFKHVSLGGCERFAEDRRCNQNGVVPVPALVVGGRTTVSITFHSRQQVVATIPQLSNWSGLWKLAVLLYKQIGSKFFETPYFQPYDYSLSFDEKVISLYIKKKEEKKTDLGEQQILCCLCAQSDSYPC